MIRRLADFGFPFDFPWLGVMSDHFTSLALVVLALAVSVDGCRIHRLETKLSPRPHAGK